jgi:hypothetical protein
MHFQGKQLSQRFFSGHSILKLCSECIVKVRSDYFIVRICGQKMVWVSSPHFHPIHEWLDDSINPLVNCLASDPSYAGEDPHVGVTYGGVVPVHLPKDQEGAMEVCKVVTIPIEIFRDCTIKGRRVMWLTTCCLSSWRGSSPSASASTSASPASTFTSSRLSPSQRSSPRYPRGAVSCGARWHSDSGANCS